MSERPDITPWTYYGFCERHWLNISAVGKHPECPACERDNLRAALAKAEAESAGRLLELNRKYEQHREADQRAERAEARLAKATAALEPFARKADIYREDTADAHVERVAITLGELRAARAALREVAP